jgi:hypothetical protein
MTNYVKTTNFLTKDSLPDDDKGKVIRGSEFDIEFNNLVISIASKANLASPEFIGVPRAPTATTGSNTNQIATTAFVTTAAGNVKDTLGTMALQDADDVNITGGSITGLTNLETADGTISGGTIGGTRVKIGDHWSLVEHNTGLYFQYNDGDEANRYMSQMRLTKEGHLMTEDNITAFKDV